MARGGALVLSTVRRTHSAFIERQRHLMTNLRFPTWMGAEGQILQRPRGHLPASACAVMG